MSESPFQFDEATRADCVVLIDQALAEDLNGTVDCTSWSVVPEKVTGSAKFVSRADGVACGLQICELVLERAAQKLDLECHLNDGDPVKKGDALATIRGAARKILLVERTCLNFMCRLSGISSLTSQFVQQALGTRAKVYDTRKTMPGWRRLEKYAVKCGGGENHRMGLYDAVMIKDNHLAMFSRVVDHAENTIPVAVGKARHWITENAENLPNGKKTVLQIEVDTLEQYRIALTCDPDIVLLDNMSTDQLCEAVEIRKEAGKPNILLEASGGVNLKTIGAIAKTGVERISVGALTHSARNFDIGLDWTLD
jgi:nicotinate-nucleotide pyrophosphorylase (carboxylating)